MFQGISQVLVSVNLVGVALGAILSLAFWFTKQGNRPANRVLSALMLVITLIMAEILGCYANLIRYTPWLINLTEPLDFLVGPLIYFYARLLVKPASVQWPQQWPHFLPGLVFTILRLPYFLQSSAFKIQDVDLCYHRPVADLVPSEPILWFQDFHFGGAFMNAMEFPHIVAYLVASIRLIYRFCRQNNESLWSSRNWAVRWLVRLAAWHTGLIALAVVFSTTQKADTGDIYIATTFSLVIMGLVGLLVRQSAVLAHVAGPPEPARKKYEKSGLAEEQATALTTRLLALMENEKPYLDGELALPDLAARLRVSPHHLSQLLNGPLQKSFADFLNEYRTAELKRQLADASLAHLKIEELAYNSGFNSKSVYNTVFKKLTGQTPSQFRKQLLNV
ncbi:MAG: helix-turn-helix domain-containing protein [Bernardetiaceae bacterium]|jgi:AraC-like DNA-binding protein|nr:helix-turn-helix domain-containing protein [Bernardetiaceae bacterium]